jgi:dynein heavy chain, axonemal
VAEANASLEITLAEVKKLKKDHLNEIKALANPPNVIRVVLGGIVILLQDSIKRAGGQIVIKTVEGKKE